MSDLIPFFKTQFSGSRLSANHLEIDLGGRPLFAGLSFMLDDGDLLWVEGENGIGKTTLLRICAGLLKATQGEVSWRRNNMPASPEQCLDYQTHLGYAKAGMTLKEDFLFWSSLSPAKSHDVLALEAVGLGGVLNTPTQLLSAGQKKRLALARLLLNERPIWIMDEPLATLDADGRDLMARGINAHLARGGLALIASHNPVKLNARRTRRLRLEQGT